MFVSISRLRKLYKSLRIFYSNFFSDFYLRRNKFYLLKEIKLGNLIN